MTQKALLQSAGDGTSVPQGYVGEYKVSNPVSTVNFGASAATTNVTSIILTPGIYMLTGMVRIQIIGTVTAFFSGISTSSNSFDSSSHISGSSTSATSAIYVPTTARFVTVLSTTTYYLNASINYSATPSGGYQTASFIQAVRIA